MYSLIRKLQSSGMVAGGLLMEVKWVRNTEQYVEQL